MGTRKIAWLGLILAVGVVLAGCGSTAAPAGTASTRRQAAKPVGSWLYRNGDPGTRGMRRMPRFIRQRRRPTAGMDLGLSSSLETSGPGFGSLAAPPIVANGVV